MRLIQNYFLNIKLSKSHHRFYEITLLMISRMLSELIELPITAPSSPCFFMLLLKIMSFCFPLIK